MQRDLASATLVAALLAALAASTAASLQPIQVSSSPIVAVWYRGAPAGTPRAEDLAAICASMARNAVEPDADLWKRLRDACAALAAPW